MDGETPMRGSFLPLVPPPPEQATDPLALHRRGLELVTAANRLALSWLSGAAAEHAALTRRTLDQMTETARRAAAAHTAPEHAQVMVDMLDRARVLGLETAQEIAALMTRMQREATELLAQSLKPPAGE